MIVRNDECVSWDADTILDLYTLDEDESIKEMLIREARGIAHVPITACAEVDFYERSYTVSLAWFTRE